MAGDPHPKPPPRVKAPKPLRAKRWGVRTSKRTAARNHAAALTLADARSQCFTRDRWACRRCGASSAAGLNAHHVALRARGGVHHVANLVTLCVSCHAWVHAHPEQATEEGWLA